MRRSSVVLAVLGVLFIVAAATVRFAIVPLETKLPANVDSTLHYAGTGTVLNSQALAAGDVANVIAKDVGMTIDRRGRVTKTDGNIAVVHDDSTLTMGTQQIVDNHVYAIDRTTLTEGTAPAGENVESHSGITIALPFDPKADSSYRYYDPPTQTAAQLNFIGTENREGREVNHYTATASGPVKDPALAKTLPAALPKALAVRMLPLLPADARQRLQEAAALLPDPIPLTYTSTTTYEMYADAQLGAPIDSGIQRSVTALVSLGGQTVPLLAVLDIDLTQTPASIAEQAGDAASNSTLLALIGVWLPVALLLVGVVLIVIAVVRRRRPPAPGAPTPAARPEPHAVTT